MLVQVQENGSYRSSDMVEALDWILPEAASSKESIIVILDWYSGHRTQEVEELVKRKEHVLLFSWWWNNAFHAGERHAPTRQGATAHDPT